MGPPWRLCRWPLQVCGQLRHCSAGAPLESLPPDWRRRAEATMGALQRPLSSSQLSQPDGDTQRTVLAGSLELRLKAKQQAVLVAAAAKADAAALRNRECT